MVFYYSSSGLRFRGERKSFERHGAQASDSRSRQVDGQLSHHERPPEGGQHLRQVHLAASGWQGLGEPLQVTTEEIHSCCISVLLHFVSAFITCCKRAGLSNKAACWQHL